MRDPTRSLLLFLGAWLTVALISGCPKPQDTPDGGGATCTVGAAGCACTAGGACDPGLMCTGGQCVAAGTDGGFTPPTNVSQLILAPAPSFKIAIGGELEVKAQVLDSNGTLLFNQPGQSIIVDWSADNPAVATVSDEGLVHGTSAGTTTVTAQVRGTAITATAEVAVQFSDMRNVFLDPVRLSLDVGSSRAFHASAVDTNGAPTTLDCVGGAELSFDSTYVGAQYDNTLGAEAVNVSGLQKGFSLLGFACGGFAATPVVLEVKPSVVVPDPSPGANGDFGLDVVFERDGEVIHVASYDRANQTLVYSRFQGVWTSETINGNGQYGRAPSMALDPASGNRPIICAYEQSSVVCWALNDLDFWVKHGVGNGGAGIDYSAVVSPQGATELVAGADGTLWLSFHDSDADRLFIARSEAVSRDDFVVTPVSAVATTRGGRFHDLTLGPDGLPRLAAQLDDVAVFGSLSDDGSAFQFEVIDSGAASPAPGTGIRLAIGTDNRPQVIFAKGNNLIHGVRTSGQWATAVIESVQLEPPYRMGWGLNRNNQPRASYHDAAAQQLRYAYRLRTDRFGVRNRWRIESPQSRTGPGAYSALLVDETSRAHIAYDDPAGHTFRYYVEPHFLDYTELPQGGAEAVTNTQVPTLAPPKGFAPSSAGNTLSATWDPTAGAAAYRVYLSDTPGVTRNAHRTEVTGPAFARPYLPLAPVWYVRVSSVSAAPPTESALSDEVAVPLVLAPAGVAVEEPRYDASGFAPGFVRRVMTSWPASEGATYNELRVTREGDIPTLCENGECITSTTSADVNTTNQKIGRLLVDVRALYSVAPLDGGASAVVPGPFSAAAVIPIPLEARDLPPAGGVRVPGVFIGNELYYITTNVSAQTSRTTHVNVVTSEYGQLASPPYPVRATYVVLGGLIYLPLSTVGTMPAKHLLVYDPVADSYTSLATPPSQIQISGAEERTCLALDGSIYCFGLTGVIHHYDVAVDSWEALAVGNDFSGGYRQTAVIDNVAYFTDGALIKRWAPGEANFISVPVVPMGASGKRMVAHQGRLYIEGIVVDPVTGESWRGQPTFCPNYAVQSVGDEIWCWGDNLEATLRSPLWVYNPTYDVLTPRD